jgi:death-on-curing protein
VTVYPNPEVLLAQLDRVGFMVRDTGLFLSAVARPQTGLFGTDAYPTLPVKIAALMDSIVNNHPMKDGNKRSSWLLANIFAELNGREIIASVDDAFVFILSIANDNAELGVIANWIERHLLELPLR